VVAPKIRKALAVPIEETLARVDADIARGDISMARQRLRGLVASYPSRLDLRELLAQSYRASGDLAQAGRWSYLSPDRVETEQEAFKRRYDGDPVRLMIALLWRGTEQDASTEVARRQLVDLRSAAEHQAGGAVNWDNPRYPWPLRRRVRRLLIGLGIAALVIFGLIGAFAAIVNGIRVVYIWLQ
jgi:hypothetical protein